MPTLWILDCSYPLQTVLRVSRHRFVFGFLSCWNPRLAEVRGLLSDAIGAVEMNVGEQAECGVDSSVVPVIAPHVWIIEEKLPVLGVLVWKLLGDIIHEFLGAIMHFSQLALQPAVFILGQAGL